MPSRRPVRQRTIVPESNNRQTLLTLSAAANEATRGQALGPASPEAPGASPSRRQNASDSETGRAFASRRITAALERAAAELERPRLTARESHFAAEARQPAADPWHPELGVLTDELERAPDWHADCGSPVCSGPHIDPPGWPPLPRLRP